MTVHVDLDLHQIAEFCQRWQISKLALFGSVLRDDFRPDSDIDVLIDFVGDPPYTFTHWIAMQEELSELLHRKIDLLDWQAVDTSPNPIRRAHILESAQVIYAR